MHALSKLTYTALFLPIPTWTISRVEKSAFGFLWGKRDRIRQRTLINNEIDGGLCMIDIESYFTSLKATRISRIHSNSRPWVAIPLHYVNCIAPFKVFSKMSF